MKLVDLRKSQSPVLDMMEAIEVSLKTVIHREAGNDTFKAVALDDKTREPREIYFTVSDTNPHDW